MNRFKELREERGYSVRGMELKTNINYNSICRYEKEERDPGTQTLKKLADFFQVSIDYMLCYSGCFVYANYKNEPFTLKLREDYYKKLKAENYIYFEDDKRFVDLNKLIGVNEDNNIIGLFQEFTRIKKLDEITSIRFPNASELAELSGDIIDIEINEMLIETIKDAIR